MANRIAVTYAVVGAAWVLLSDWALDAIVRDPALHLRLQTGKGWLFVLLSTALIFYLVRSAMRRREATIEELRDSQQALRNANDQANEMNRAYEEKHRQYERLFSANPQPMWVYDLETLQFLEVNGAAIEHYGYPRDEWPRMRITDIRPEKDVPALLENVRANRRETFSDTEVWTHRKRDGSLIQVEVSAHATQFNGRPARVVTATDVTEQVEAAAREHQLLQRTKEAMRGTITVVDRMVELRDPYTAGHERRVAEIAEAIGRGMHLSPIVFEGLSLGAAIHDIGKISIPSDILARPGTLTPLEYEYVQYHATAGYELLKDISFPWPLAEIVYQHHERLDGSGYPRGLKGDEILLESRILAVADVVEAMSSHRPYRPSRGIGPALEEIEFNAGTLYDPIVVQTLLTLVREKGYRLPAA